MVVLLTAFVSTSAQSAPSGDIRGHVVNSASNTPLAGITVDVSPSGSQATIGRATTGTDGAFRLTGLKPGRYHAHIRSLGYAPWDNPSIAVAATSVDLGTIRLTNVALQLESVAVSERR